MDEMDYADMIEQSPVDTYVVEYREPSNGDRPGKLIGVCLTDRQGDGLSMIYSFFDPDHPARDGLGTFIILDHITRAGQAGLPYVYLGYWIDGCRRMEYKTNFRPMERLGPSGWSLYEDGVPPPTAGAFDFAALRQIYDDAPQFADAIAHFRGAALGRLALVSRMGSGVARWLRALLLDGYH
jgi:leucyl-tRNA---protein transferase